MPQGQNPYYNPVWADAAKNIATAITGDPERMGAAAYQRAKTRESTLAGDRQEMENMALQTGMEDALAAGGTDPAAITAAMPRILATMARAGINAPSNYLTPQWAVTGMSQSGASPAEALVRSAYAGAGKDIPLDLALTPERADNIRAQEFAAALEKAVATQAERNKAPSSSRGSASPQKPPKMADTNAIMNNVFAAIPGATETDQYHRTQVAPEAQDYFASQGLLEPMRNLVVETLRATGGDQEAARAAVMKAMNLPAGAEFDQARVVDRTPGTALFPWNWGGKESSPAIVTPDGASVDMQGIVNALSAAMSQAAPTAAAAPPSQGIARVNTPAEAMALPPGTQFMTPDGRVKVRP